MEPALLVSHWGPILHSALVYLFIWELFVLALEKAGILQKSK